MIHNTKRSGRRRGVVLLIVMALLALFASVGLAFVFYAEAEAGVAQTAKSGENKLLADVEPELLLNYFLNQLIYDTTNEYSALRGYSLARTEYGGDPTYEQSVVSGASPVASGVNGIPFNGVGNILFTHTFGKAAGANSRQLLVNTKYDADGFTLMPGWYSVKEDAANRRFLGGENGPTTYPSLSNPFLAAVNARGEVLLPSYKRWWAEMAAADPNYASFGKYTTFTPHPTYHPAFQGTDADGGPPVKQLPFGPGTRNPAGGYFLGDSYWISAGFPVITAANGKKYTVLFAPLIVDLDNRVNLLAHGNIRGPGNTHLSHHGFGRWEVNPTRNDTATLATTTPIVSPADFATFVTSIGRTPTTPLTDSRYWWLAANRGPAPPPPPPPYPPAGSRFDFDASTTAMAMPSGTNAAANNFSIYPTYPAGFDNGDPGEVATHPAGYNYFGLAATVKHPSHLDALYNSFGKGSPALTSNLFKFMSPSLVTAGNPYDANKIRARNLMTVLSHDFNRPGLIPFLQNNATYASTYTYTYPIPPGGMPYPVGAATAAAPAGAPQPFPSPPAAPPFKGDFNDAPWAPYAAKSLDPSKPGMTMLERLNLNRPLTEYPPPAPTTGFMNPADPVYLQAVQDRQTMANDIYKYLVMVTGAQDPNVVAIGNTTPQFRAARWLAQLAVNIVDYIDNDDYMTPFPWNVGDLTPANAKEMLFGTEKPSLVINEAYAQYDDNPNDSGLQDPDPKNWIVKDGFYRLSCWAELYNPGDATVAGYNWPRDGGAAKLKGLGGAIYQLALKKADPNPALPAAMRAPENAIGVPDPATIWQDPTNGPCVVKDWGTNGDTFSTVAPLPAVPGNRFNNPAVGPGGPAANGFFVVGPDLGAKTFVQPARDPAFAAPSHKSKAMTARVAINDPAVNPTVTLVLQRLACPHLPPAADNPYVTVDFVEIPSPSMITVTDKVVGQVAAPPPWGASMGRRQPFAAAAAALVAQNPNAAGAPAGLVKNTFYRQNCVENATPVDFNRATTPTQTLDPFDWLVHLDRPLVSTMELVHCSGYRPHELTQQFVTVSAGNVYRHNHRAPWYNEAGGTTGSPERATAENSLIYRFLEVAGTPDLMAGQSYSGRVPGKININTIWDLETFLALCDPNGSSGFSVNDAKDIYFAMYGIRTPGPNGTPENGGGDDGMPFMQDRTFAPFSIGVSDGGPGKQSPFPTGVDNTLIRSLPGNPAKRLFEPPLTTSPGGAPPNPYQKLELLTKIYNSVTTRSNCFAVWVTMGFFEVDDSVNPPRLGAEVGRADNRHIRHKFFAIIDRTAIKARLSATPDGSGPENRLTLVADTVVPAGTTVTTTVNVPQMSFPLLSGGTLNIVPGTVVTLSPDLPNEETTIVETVGANSFTCKNVRSHKAGEEVIFRCWTGPWRNYDVRRDTAVVPYFTVID